MPRYFTLKEAQALLPEIEALIEDVISAKAKYEEANEELRSAAERITLSGGANVDRDKLVARKHERESLAERLKQLIESVHNRGCLIKDLDLGLVDFPTFFRGREVYLCWKRGESGIKYWHGVDEGFRGRKEIDRDFLEHHGASEDSGADV